MNNDLDHFTGGDAERVQHQASLFDPGRVASDPRRRQRLGRARRLGRRRLLRLARPHPHDRACGATRFHTGGDISGHSSYFNEGSESLRDIGLIAAGYLDE